MAKKCLQSDLSIQEAHFLTCGNPFFGEENAITGLYKLIGKYEELKESGRGDELIDFNPDDKKFGYENRGITKLSVALKSKYGNKEISRWQFKALSRKWCPKPVRISFNSACIILELITYINSDDNLKLACQKYLLRYGNEWEELMPIQFDFLRTRFIDQRRNYRIAGKIINELSDIDFN